MGVHHAWGRAYKDAPAAPTARCAASTSDSRMGSTARASGSRSTSSGTSASDQARHRGLRNRPLRHRLQAARPGVCREPDRAVHPPRPVDALGRSGQAAGLRDQLGVDPQERRDDRGGEGPVTDTVERLVGRLGMPEIGGSYFTFSDENNYCIWGFLKRCHERGLYNGHDVVPWCARCGTAIGADGDERGLPGPRGPRADASVFPWSDLRPARVAARLDDHPLDPHQSNVAVAVGPDLGYVAGPPGRRPLLGRRGGAQAGGPGAVRGGRGRGAGAELWAGRMPVRTTSCRGAGGGSAERSRTGSSPGARSAPSRGPAWSTSPRAAGRRTSRSREATCR